jgi:ribosome-associated protein
MQTVDFQLRGEFVALCDLLKLAGVADSGGQGKALVAGGEVTVDGRREDRKTAKIRPGQVVQCQGVRINVVAVSRRGPE